MKTNKTATIAEQIAAIEAEKQRLLGLQAADEQKRIDDIVQRVNALPKQFGVDNLESVRALIKKVETGTLGKLASDAGTRKERTVVSVEDQDAWLNRLTEFGGSEQRSTIATQANVAYGTVHNWVLARKERDKVKVAGARELVETQPAPTVAVAA